MPHVGHAIEFIQADAYARYFRKKLGKENVLFNVGVDEHGLKVFSTATKEGKSPKTFLDELIPKWLDFCTKFRISYDNFYRTSLEDHHEASKIVWNYLYKKGDIYKKHYEGNYCVGCEAFLLEKDLVDGKCPDHNSLPIKQSEENYFFKLSKYSTKICEYIESNSEFIQPKSKRNELINFVKNIEDISISRNRNTLPWGVEVPHDPEHTMYVWFDALINYIRTIGYGKDEEKFKSYWPGVQLCGPDNLRFQGAIWQGMLAALDLDFTKKILVHGMIFSAGGQKMSKSMGNVIAPLDQYEKYGSDVIRFYMLGVLRTYNDCSYNESDLILAYNSHLANNYGNLLNRLIHLGNIKNIDILDINAVETPFKEHISSVKKEVEALYESFEIYEAVERILNLISYGNQYIHEQEPWKKELKESHVILNNVSYLLITATELLEPIIPDGAAKAIVAIRKKEKQILYPRILDK
ncbi:MAG: methionine--tRNA ligase [Fibrobacteres bacterium]|nr:methionine--tRNA ligase [Fibrobacterota bacterium]